MLDILFETQIKTKATLICPECQISQKAIMPTEGKQHFYKCSNEECGADIATKADECCVFCSYADVLCPAKQLNPDEDEGSKLRSLI